MVNTLIASAVVTLVGFAGIALIMLASERRWRKEKEAFFARLAVQRAEMEAQQQHTEAVLNNLKIEVPKPYVPDSRASTELVERLINALDTTAESGVTDDEADDEVADPAPPVTIDLGDLANRLSEAGFAGDTLRLASVEFPGDRHVVVHLEPQQP